MKKVLITGATGGIGSKIAESLASNKYEIILLCRTLNDLSELKKKLLGLRESNNANIKIISCDVSDYNSLKKGLEDISEIDVLINCAGILGPVGPFSENDIDEWHKTIDINLHGTVNTIHLLLDKLRKSDRGKIINFSGGGAAFPRIYHTAYSASKAAIVRFTEILAVEYPDIDVNAIAPGAHKTRIWNTETYDKEPAIWGDMNRLQELILFLCNHDSDGLSGKFIHINDDWNKIEFKNANEDYYTLRRMDERLVNKLRTPIVVKNSPPSDSKICVFGLWHLGSVTCACLSDLGFNVVGLDTNQDNVANLNNGKAPIYEPDLDELLQKGLKNKKLSFSTDMKSAVSSADFVWVTFDTPVDENDVADIPFMEEQVKSLFPYLKNDANIIVSSQIPVNFTRKMEKECSEKYSNKNITFAVSPENLRLGDAIRIFNGPDRIIVGIRNPEDKKRLEPLFSAITDKIEWMKTESAEMTKHAINSFLATSIVFANELANICESVGADAKEVERGLKTEERIGPKARLGPGAAFAGGTLARDINFLIDKGHASNKKTTLLNAIKESNDHHKGWIGRKCLEIYGDIKGVKFGVLGLTYKPETDTLRRSLSVELCEWIHEKSGIVNAYDPHVKTLPENLAKKIHLKHTAAEVLRESECIIISTEHKSLKQVYNENKELFSNKVVIDTNGFIAQDIPEDRNFRYICVGRMNK